MAKTRVYIDGFNLYHGAIAPSRMHWLNLQEFAFLLNRTQDVDHVTYCTAMVSGPPDDPNKAIRQAVYHQAIRAACPKVEIVLGNFTTHKRPVPVAGCVNAPPCLVKVAIRNEKGSDVNLASRLLHDAHMGRFDRAIVVSGDSDLAEPIRLVTQEIGKVVWVRNPRDVASAELEAVASDYARIRPAVLISSQLPNPLVVGAKTYHKPGRWSAPSPARTKHDVLNVNCPEAGCTKCLTTARFI